MKMPDFSKFVTSIVESRTARIVLSILSAILIWFILSVTVYTTAPRTFYNIPLVVDIAGSPAEASGLSVISQDVEKVNIQIEGNRSQVGILKPEDLIAFAKVDSVSASGTYTLDISIKNKDNIKFNMTSVSPSRVNVRFERLDTRTFEVSAEIPNVAITPGHTIDTNSITCDPSTVQITGPASQLDKIGSVKVYMDSRQEIDTSHTFNSNSIRLYNTSGSLLDDTENLTIPDQNFKISVPVMTQKELALTYSLLKAPKNFDTEWLMERLMLSDSTITLASPDSMLASNESLSLGDVILGDITLKYQAALEVPVPENCINQSGFQQVSLILDDDGLSERDFIVNSNNISIINAPSTYDMQIITKSLTVTLVGPTEELNELSTDDILLTVDLMNYDISQSPSFTQTASVNIVRGKHIWATGKYSIALKATEVPSDDDE